MPHTSPAIAVSPQETAPSIPSTREVLASRLGDSDLLMPGEDGCTGSASNRPNGAVPLSAALTPSAAGDTIAVPQCPQLNSWANTPSGASRDPPQPGQLNCIAFASSRLPPNANTHLYKSMSTVYYPAATASALVLMAPCMLSRFSFTFLAMRVLRSAPMRGMLNSMSTTLANRVPPFSSVNFQSPTIFS
jgi:hypothetical protein